MLVNATNMLLKARDGHYAVGQFNINNLEWTKSILLTAQEMNSPVILGVSEGAGKYMTGFKTVAAMVKAMDESLGITVPVACIWITAPMRVPRPALPPASPPSCSMAATTPSTRTSPRPPSWSPWPMTTVCPLSRGRLHRRRGGRRHRHGRGR